MAIADGGDDVRVALRSEQLAGRRDPVVPNRAAIALLCTAGRHLAHAERRRPARESIAAWLRGAALFRATHSTDDSFGDTGYGAHRQQVVARGVPVRD